MSAPTEGSDMARMPRTRHPVVLPFGRPGRAFTSVEREVEVDMSPGTVLLHIPDLPTASNRKPPEPQGIRRFTTPSSRLFWRRRFRLRNLLQLEGAAVWAFVGWIVGMLTAAAMGWVR